jgi:hypothetical protein
MSLTLSNQIVAGAIPGNIGSHRPGNGAKGAKRGNILEKRALWPAHFVHLEGMALFQPSGAKCVLLGAMLKALGWVVANLAQLASMAGVSSQILS